MGRSIKEVLSLTDNVRLGTTSSSPFLGSPTFDEVPFHLDVGCRPSLGTYVIIERDSNTEVHYGRIISGTEDNPRANPSSLQQNQTYQIGQKDTRPGDRSPHVTRVMTAEVLGEILLDDNENLAIREPNLLAQTGKYVYELPADKIPKLLNTPDSEDNGFHIGLIQSGNHSVNFMLPMEAIARHLAVVGKTGVGKSYATGVLIEELVRHNIPVISNRQVNQALERLGLQKKEKISVGKCQWELTEEGKKYGKVYLATSTSSNWSGSQIKWSEQVIDLLKLDFSKLSI